MFKRKTLKVIFFIDGQRRERYFHADELGLAESFASDLIVKNKVNLHSAVEIHDLTKSDVSVIWHRERRC